uniref:Uncharacterized protein n=1 Tax=Fagus sylvatica TaxID=28930 RepID=A0A2N9FBE9_FAGSY
MSTPPVLSNAAGNCGEYKPECIGDAQKVLFYTALALIAIGVSGHITSLGSFLNCQKDQDDPNWKRLWRFPGAVILVLLPIVACIALPYIKPWSVRFGIPAISAGVETRRLDVIRRHGLLDKPNETIPMSMFVLLPQFLFLGALDGVSNFSMIDSSLIKLLSRSAPTPDQAPTPMTSYSQIFSYGVIGAGTVGSVLSVYVVGKASESGGKPSWFQDTLNKSRLDNYYWTLAALSSINLVLYILVAQWYTYKDHQLKTIKIETENEESTQP